MNKKTLLLTGATGFLGSHLLKEMVKENYRVVILKRSTSDLGRIAKRMENVWQYDIDVVPLENVFEDQKIDIIVHAACNYGRSEQSISDVVETNIMLGVRLLELAISNGVNMFLNVDTFFNTAECDLGYMNNYALSKRQFIEWLIIKSEIIKVANMKLQHVYGPMDGKEKFIPWIVNCLSKNVIRIPLTIGTQLRDFIYIDDVVSAFMLIIEKEKTLSRYNEFDVGTGVLSSVKEFVTTLYESYKAYNPNVVTELGFGDVPLRRGEMMSVSVDNRNLKMMGWKPAYSIKQGCMKVVSEFDW
jgi:nucleoside-diphosphate-sugar epimerase